MNYKKLGNTDLNVSTICLGTMTWGEQNTEKDAFQQMDYALNNGVNFWDTAELYSVPPKKDTYGITEKIIGNWFEKTKKRKDVILASKVAGPSRNYLRDGQNSFVGKNLDAPQGVSFDKPTCLILPESTNFFRFPNTSSNLFQLPVSLCSYPSLPKVLVFLSGQCNW